MATKRVVIIVAGGSGSRMRSAIPKQFLLLQDQPVLMHTIQQFTQFDNEMKVILVLPKDQIAFWKELCEKHHFKTQHTIIEGGETRFHSVKNGFSSLKDTSEMVIGIHDGVRPLVSQNTIENAYQMAEEKGSGVPVIPVNDSVRVVENEENKAVDRSSLRIVQTPQCFRSEWLKGAYKQEFNPAFTDDARVVEASEKKIHLSEGNSENIKITTPSDLKIAEAIKK